MPFLLWKEEGFWGCEDCEFVLREPKARESLGEYEAAIRNAFDAHHCKDYRSRQPQQASNLLVLKKAANLGH
jgi:hypothetical protein